MHGSSKNILRSSIQVHKQASSGGLRLGLLSVLDHPPTQPATHPHHPGIVVLHGLEFEFTIELLMKVVVVEIIYSYPGPNLNDFSLIYKNLINNNLIQSSSQE